MPQWREAVGRRRSRWATRGVFDGGVENVLERAGDDVGADWQRSMV